MFVFYTRVAFINVIYRAHITTRNHFHTNTSTTSITEYCSIITTHTTHRICAASTLCLSLHLHTLRWWMSHNRHTTDYTTILRYILHYSAIYSEIWKKKKKRSPVHMTMHCTQDIFISFRYICLFDLGKFSIETF